MNPPTRIYILGFLTIVIGWAVLISSLVAFYLVVQASHPNLTPQQLSYNSCLYSSDSKSVDSCAKILKVKL